MSLSPTSWNQVLRRRDLNGGDVQISVTNGPTYVGALADLDLDGPILRLTLADSAIEDPESQTWSITDQTTWELAFSTTGGLVINEAGGLSFWATATGPSPQQVVVFIMTASGPKLDRHTWRTASLV